MFTDKTESLMVFLIQKLMMAPITNPKRGPPSDTRMKFPTTPVTDDEFPLARSMKSIKKTIAVPSFNKDSPSTKVLNLTLAPNYFSKATTATGSVAERTHPRVNA